MKHRQHDHEPDEDQLRKQGLAVARVPELIPGVPLIRQVGAGRDQNQQGEPPDDREAPAECAEEVDSQLLGKDSTRNPYRDAEEDQAAGPDGRPDQVQRANGGVAAACLCGVAYAVLNVILRYCITRGAPLPTTLFTVSVTGLVALGLISWLRIGHRGMLETRPHDLALMFGAGLCNTVAFIALTKSLQLTSVVYVNALNATQATLAAIAGVLIFGEALSPWLALGVGLTIVGLMCLAHAHRAMRAAIALTSD